MTVFHTSRLPVCCTSCKRPFQTTIAVGYGVAFVHTIGDTCTATFHTPVHDGQHAKQPANASAAQASNDRSPVAV